MGDAQSMINAKRAGADVKDQEIVDAFTSEIDTIKASHPDLFAKLVAAMADIVIANPPAAE